MVRIRTWMATLVGVVAVAMVLSGVALAAPNGKALGHSKDAGGTPSASGAKSGKASKPTKPPKDKGGTRSGVTEDNDDDGVPNTPDPHGDADNRHPSGKDKHAESGGSGNQGQSASEPDGNGKGPERDEGGLDKPGGSGGLDVLDQDGNNGCGNDDDFEDDNEGLCLGLGRGEEAPSGESDTEVTIDESGGQSETVGVTEIEAVGDSAEVLGITVQKEDVARVRAAVAGAAAPAVAGVPLAFTGVHGVVLIPAAVSLAVMGWALLLLGRRRSSGG